MIRPFQKFKQAIRYFSPGALLACCLSVLFCLLFPPPLLLSLVLVSAFIILGGLFSWGLITYIIKPFLSKNSQKPLFEAQPLSLTIQANSSSQLLKLGENAKAISEMEIKLEKELEVLKQRSSDVERLIKSRGTDVQKILKENISFFMKEYKRLTILCHPDKVSLERQSWAKRVFIELNTIIQESKASWYLALGKSNDPKLAELLQKMEEALEVLQKKLMENAAQLDILRGGLHEVSEGVKTLSEEIRMDNYFDEFEALMKRLEKLEEPLVPEISNTI